VKVYKTHLKEGIVAKKKGQKKTNEETSSAQAPGNRRRFPRVNLQNQMDQAKIIVGAKVDWLDQCESEVFDISYKGVAVNRPQGLSLRAGDTTDLKLILGKLEPCTLKAKVVWFNDHVVGLEFLDIDHVTRMIIDEFLEDKIIGAHMVPVSPQYFSEQVDFQYWYHGPNNTNVFLWESGDNQLTRAMVSFDDQAMIFEEGAFHRAGSEMDWDVQASYSTETLPSQENEDLLVILEKDSPLVQRSIEILTQLKDQSKSINNLLKKMIEAKG